MNGQFSISTLGRVYLPKTTNFFKPNKCRPHKIKKNKSVNKNKLKIYELDKRI